jgi:hypothetical protein
MSENSTAPIPFVISRVLTFVFLFLPGLILSSTLPNTFQRHTMITILGRSQQKNNL